MASDLKLDDLWLSKAIDELVLSDDLDAAIEVALGELAAYGTSEGVEKEWDERGRGRKAKAKVYDIHDLPFTKDEALTASLAKQYKKNPTLRADSEASLAYSSFMPWNRAVTDASVQYIATGKSAKEISKALKEPGANGGFDAKEGKYAYGITGTLMNDSLPVVSGESNKFTMSPDKAAAAAVRLVDSIREAPEEEHGSGTLYRGLGSDTKIDSLEKLKEGDAVDMQRLTSFSTRQTVADRFSTGGRQILGQDFKPNANQYRFELEGPVKGLNLDILSGRDQGEVVTQGRFKVTGIEHDTREYILDDGSHSKVPRTIFHIKQTGVL